jgi:hypothetical protein
MSITERLMRQGAFTVELARGTPEDVLDAVGFFDSIVVTNQHLDLNDGWGDADMLTAATYTGMVRVIPRGDERLLEGIGNLGWLGDENGKGQILIAGDDSLLGYLPGTATFAGWWTGLLGTVDAIAAPLTAGTIDAITAPSGLELTSRFDLMNRRQIGEAVGDYYGGEFRCNTDFSVDAGADTDLFVTTTPTAIIVRAGSGDDPLLRSIRIDAATVTKDVIDYVTDVIAVGEGVTGSDTITSPFKDPLNAAVKRGALRNIDGDGLGPVADEFAAVYLGIADQAAETVTISTQDFDSEGAFKVGDTIYIFDPDSGLVDAATQKQFRGDVVFPTTIRVVGAVWPITSGMGVYTRTGGAVYTDLTEHVVFEDSPATLEIGARPRPHHQGVSSSGR